MHNKIEVNLSPSPSATYNTIEANIIKKSCQEHSLTLLSVFQKPCSSPRLPTSLPQIRSNILNFQDTCEQRSGDDSSEKRIRLERPNHEPVRRSAEENVVCPRTMRYPRDLPPPLCPIRDVGSVESVVQFQPRRLKVKLVVSRFSVNEKFSSRMQPRLSRAITGLIMEISIPEWFWREKYALISVFSNINLVINDSVRFLLGVVKKFNYTRRECLIGLGNFFLFFLSQISLIKFLWFIDM